MADDDISPLAITIRQTCILMKQMKLFFSPQEELCEEEEVLGNQNADKKRRLQERVLGWKSSKNTYQKLSEMMHQTPEVFHLGYFDSNSEMENYTTKAIASLNDQRGEAKNG